MYESHEVKFTRIEPENLTKLPEPEDGEVIYIAKGEFEGKGTHGIIERVSPKTVIKTPLPNPYNPSEEVDIRLNVALEADIYQMIGPHPRVPRVHGFDPETCCLTLEYLPNGDLETYIRHHNDTISSRRRYRWVRQAAEAVRLLHALGIIHSDITPRNFLLDAHLNLKIADFAGAVSVSDFGSGCPSGYFRHPDHEEYPDFVIDVFGLGSLIYFIETGRYPFEDEDVDSSEAQKRFRDGDFPDTGGLVCGDIIEECWVWTTQRDLEPTDITAICNLVDDTLLFRI